MRVLLINDEADRAAAVRAGLEAAGCIVVAVAPDVADLTRMVREAAADVIVCDLDDPGGDALERMRAMHRDEPRPVVVFAARGEPDQIEAAIEAGVAAYVAEGLAAREAEAVVAATAAVIEAQRWLGDPAGHAARWRSPTLPDAPRRSARRRRRATKRAAPR